MLNVSFNLHLFIYFVMVYMHLHNTIPSIRLCTVFVNQSTYKCNQNTRKGRFGSFVQLTLLFYTFYVLVLIHVHDVCSGSLFASGSHGSRVVL